MEILTTYSIPFSIIVRVISCIILALFLIPLQIKEAGVKNGLRVLRIQLLVAGIVLFMTNLFSLGFLFLAMEVPQKPLNAFLQIINALAFLILAFIAQSVYRTQYTDEAKDLHAKIDLAEKRGKVIKDKASVKAKGVLATAKKKADNLLKNPKK